MFQIGNQVLVANNILGRIARKTDIAPIAKAYNGRLLECENGNIYRFVDDVGAKEFYNWLNSVVCNTPDGWEPFNGFQY